ncbi:DUF1508 domain-containing protein [Sinorhizobium meliloti]|uniref:YegP family protein n=1 Tax=Rhizobium meliloti TaxID=382 RepID=UPI00299EAB5E
MQPAKERIMAEVTYPCYWQKRDKTGQWYWIYYAKNKEEIARSSESYVNRSDCTHSISLVKNSMSDQIFYSE